MAATGDLVWQKRLAGNFSASPVVAGERVYITSNEGTTIVLQIGDEPTVLAENPLGEEVQASAAISQGSLFLRTAAAVYRIGAR
jgi:outer membrane protein assembly factor BamB